MVVEVVVVVGGAVVGLVGMGPAGGLAGELTVVAGGRLGVLIVGVVGVLPGGLVTGYRVGGLVGSRVGGWRGVAAGTDGFAGMGTRADPPGRGLGALVSTGEVAVDALEGRRLEWRAVAARAVRG